MQEKIVGVINGFRLVLKERKITKNVDVEVKFYMNGRYYASIKFNNISSSQKVGKIRETMADYIEYNMNVETQCQAISFLTIISMLDGIVNQN